MDHIRDMYMQSSEYKSSSSPICDETATTSARRRKNKLLLDSHDHSIKDLCGQIETVAVTNSNVIIDGEAGIGKELVARAIHAMSDRSSQPFISVNCADFSSDHIDSHLFGLVKGAFTPARDSEHGQLQLADSGTIYLNNLAEISVETKEKLIQIVRQRKFEKVGSHAETSLNVRIISSLQMDYEEHSEDEIINSALHKALNPYSITMPLLRREAEDMPDLICAITEKIRQQTNVSFTITNDVIKILSCCSWPDNSAGLFNLIAGLSILYPSEHFIDQYNSTHDSKSTVTSKSIRQEIFKKNASSNFSHLPESGFNLKSYIAELEVHYIREALEVTNGVVAQAAKLLGLRRTTLVEKLRKYGIQK